jgi:hypothetical protein
MSTSAVNYQMIKELESRAKAQGFEIICDSHFGSTTLCLTPREDCLPIYTRGVSLAFGTAEELISFLNGWYKAREYLSMLGIKENKIERAEQNYRNKRLMEMIKHGKDNIEKA